MYTCPYWQLNQIFAAHDQHPDLKPFATALMLVAAEGTDKVSSSEYAELARSFSQEVDAVKTSMRVRMERTVQGPLAETLCPPVVQACSHTRKGLADVMHNGDNITTIYKKQDSTTERGSADFA